MSLSLKQPPEPFPGCCLHQTEVTRQMAHVSHTAGLKVLESAGLETTDYFITESGTT